MLKSTKILDSMILLNYCFVELTISIIPQCGEHMKSIRLEIPVMVTLQAGNTVAAEQSQAF